MEETVKMQTDGIMADISPFDIVASKWLIAAIAAIWTPLPLAIQILCIVSMVDLATVLFNPTRRLGLATKRVSIILILTFTICILSDMAKAKAGFNIGFDICSAVAFFYALSAGIRIMQNVNAAGVSLPPVLLDFMSKAEGITGSERDEIDALKLSQGQAVDALAIKQNQETDALKKKQEAGD